MQAIVDTTEFRITGKYDHYIGVITAGFAGLPEEDQIAIINAFGNAPKGDHFYSITYGSTRVYVAENGQKGFTAMLTEEY